MSQTQWWNDDGISHEFVKVRLNIVLSVQMSNEPATDRNKSTARQQPVFLERLQLQDNDRVFTIQQWFSLTQTDCSFGQNTAIKYSFVFSNFFLQINHTQKSYFI